MNTIRLAGSDDEVLSCFPVMRQLREHLADEEFVSRIRTQEEQGYRLVLLEDGETVRAVTGFRILENLASGRVLYVDDLVTDERARSAGYGARLLAWLVERARDTGCDTLELDSGVQRFDAHRFYLRNRMVISSHHFRLVLVPPAARPIDATGSSPGTGEVVK